jgi:hypothetical protein
VPDNDLITFGNDNDTIIGGAEKVIVAIYFE